MNHDGGLQISLYRDENIIFIVCFKSIITVYPLHKKRAECRPGACTIKYNPTTIRDLPDRLCLCFYKLSQAMGNQIVVADRPSVAMKCLG